MTGDGEGNFKVKQQLLYDYKISTISPDCFYATNVGLRNFLFRILLTRGAY